MTREQTIEIFKVLKLAYPTFYKDMTRDEAESTIALWTQMFKNDDPTIVIATVKSLITTFKWPPTIADVKEEMDKLTNNEEESPIELWNRLRKALSNSIYGSNEEYNKLPPIVKKFVGSPNQLRNWAIDENFNEGVLRGQFLKQLEILQEREKEDRMIPFELRQMIQAAVKGVEPIMLEDKEA